MAFTCVLCIHALNIAAAPKPSGWLEWFNCTGCGVHLFDTAGWPACRTGAPVVHGDRCPDCRALVNETELVGGIQL